MKCNKTYDENDNCPNFENRFDFEQKRDGREMVFPNPFNQMKISPDAAERAAIAFRKLGVSADEAAENLRSNMENEKKT